MITFKTVYKDQFGEENCFFLSDGSSLEIKLRDITFYGMNFDDLEPSVEIVEQAKEKFNFEKKYLTDCEFNILIPVKIMHNEVILEHDLNVQLILSSGQEPKSRFFGIEIDGKIYDANANSERPVYFDYQLATLQKILPKNIKFRSCLFCALSDYWVAGSDSFGTLGCYKEIKSEFLKRESKSDYIDIAMLKGVAIQETYYCPEFMEIFEGQWIYKDL